MPDSDFTTLPRVKRADLTAGFVVKLLPPCKRLLDNGLLYREIGTLMA